MFPAGKDYLNKVLQPFHAQCVELLLADVQAAENKAYNIFVRNAGSQDHKKNNERGEKQIMGEVIGLIRVMPGEVISDEEIQKMIDDIKAVIKPPAKVGRIDIKNIAFGLKGLDVTVMVPDDAGGLDPIAEKISKVENVESAEVTDVGRV